MVWKLTREEYALLARGQHVFTVVNFLDENIMLDIRKKGEDGRPELTLGALSASVRFTAISIAGENFGECTVEKGSEHHLWLKDSSEIEKEEIHFVANVVEIDDKSISDLVKSKLDAEKLLKEAAEEKMQQIGFELEKEQIARKHAEDRLQALIDAGSDQAAERVRRLTRSAVKIQAKWRQVSAERARAEMLKQFQQAKLASERETCSVVKIQAKWRQVSNQRRQMREDAETVRRLKHAKFVEAINSLKHLWCLKKKRRERRWLHAQKCSEAETPYDAILVIFPQLIHDVFSFFLRV